MTREDAEQTLATAGATEDGKFPLLEAALSCALHDNPDRDGGVVLRLVDEAVSRLKLRLRKEAPEDALCEALGGDIRLKGDLFTPDDPANSDLIAACERRRGLSIVLGVVYLEAGRRCGLHVAGVDFPGHFLLRVETPDGPIALDPFSGGRVVMPSELTRRALNTGLTPDVADRLEVLMAPVSHRQVVIRLQNTIFAQAMQAHDYERAERSAVRRALLDPGDHRPWIDVATARERQGRLSGALQALSRAQDMDGGGAAFTQATRERVRMRLN